MVSTIFNFRHGLALTVASLLSVFAPSAISATSNYNIAGTCTSSNVLTCSVSDMTVTGWSNATTTTTSGQTYYESKLYSWGSAGLGIVNTYELSTTDGPHAIDNKYGNDSMMFQFNAASNISSLTIGWDGTDNAVTGYYNDSDLAIYYWSGGAGGPVAGSPKTLTSPTVAGAGWTLVGNYCDVGAKTAGTGNDTLNLVTSTQCLGAASSYSASTYSSYWLVTGYKTSSTSYDAFKMVSLVGSTNPGCTTNCNQVPEPGTLALVALATLGMTVSRRRVAK